MNLTQAITKLLINKCLDFVDSSLWGSGAVEWSKYWNFQKWPKIIEKFVMPSDSWDRTKRYSTKTALCKKSNGWKVTKNRVVPGCTNIESLNSETISESKIYTNERKLALKKKDNARVSNLVVWSNCKFCHCQTNDLRRKRPFHLINFILKLNFWTITEIILALATTTS